MRIAICGAQGMGKTTLINDLIKEWPSYSIPKESYRDFLKTQNLPHSSKTTKDTQWQVLNFMVDSLQKTKKGDKIVFDRSPLDNLVYTLWQYSKGGTDIDDVFIEKCIPIVRESLSFLDVIFYIPITKAAPLPVLVDDGFRETNPVYRLEIDNLFKVLARENNDNPDSKYFKRDDRPPIIEIFGEPKVRIEMLKLYLDAEGDAYDDSTSLISPELMEITGESKSKYV